jgi:hypothetical protein
MYAEMSEITVKIVKTCNIANFGRESNIKRAYLTFEDVDWTKAYTFGGGFFMKCPQLEELTLDGAVIQSNGLNLQWSTKLSHDSLMNIINALKDYSGDTSGTVWTCTLGNENLAKLTAEQEQIALNKGWVLE